MLQMIRTGCLALAMLALHPSANAQGHELVPWPARKAIPALSVLSYFRTRIDSLVIGAIGALYVRDAVVRQCAQRLGLDPSASLGDIRVRAEEPWASMLAEHQDALLALVAGTERLAATNRELAQRGAKETQSVLDAVTGSVTTNAYGPSTGRGLARPTLVDRRA